MQFFLCLSYILNKIVAKRGSKSSLRCPCSIPEDVPIDLGIIATRIKVPPYYRIINAALEPLRQVLEVAALLAKVLGEIFGAIVFAFVALLKIFERALIPIAQISLVRVVAMPVLMCSSCAVSRQEGK